VSVFAELKLKHWRLEQDVDGFLFVYINRAREAVNSLSRAMLLELETIIDAVTSNPVEGLCFISAKSSGFIAGFDIREFDKFRSAADILPDLEYANTALSRIEKLPFPTVAAIDGFCMGGGLELALACDYRVATTNDKTRLGLPEVQLGLHPGFGGTMRLCRLIGGKDAVPLMLTGKGLRASAAKRLGLIDQVVKPHSDLRWTARKLMQRKPKKHKATFTQTLTNSRLARPILAKIMERATRKKARPEHYPAPFAIIDLWRKHGNNCPEMLKQEAPSFAKLFETEAATNLRRVFHLMEGLKSQSKGAKFDLKRVHVIGAGIMGGDIAAWCALRGFEVTLQDREQVYIDGAVKRAKSLFAKRAKPSSARKAAGLRLISDLNGDGIARADVVIEAIVEDLEIKRALYADVEPRMKKGAILATNTSALPLDQLAEGLKRPGQFIGLHFFNPVAALPLVEVIAWEKSKKSVVKAGCKIVSDIGKFPLEVKSAPGFVVNRVLAPYLIEAMHAHNEGSSMDDIDAAAEAFGMPVGPIELADQIGLDVCLHVTGTLGSDENQAMVSKQLQPMIDKDKKGKKSGEGFYVWKKGKPVRKNPGGDMTPKAVESLAQRLISPLLEECERVMADQIVASEDMLDAGVIFGTGFAPFRGGPLHYKKQRDQGGTSQ
jgi:3-hydroxyacyl-CoA dehydrogenase / enoyl-CoA hydratase / 3-hydroxybutyryl-CoA epimerase